MNIKKTFLNELSLRQNSSFMEIIQKIWQRPGISRKEISLSLGLSKGAITKNINQLIDSGWCHENGATARSGGGGRNQIGLQLKSDLFYAVGVCLYKNNSKVLLLDASSVAVKELPFLWNTYENYQIKCERLKEALNTLLEDIDREKIIGTGVALPGFFDNESGVVYCASGLEGALSFNLKEFFINNFGLQCTLYNISHLRPMIEHLWGGAKKMQTFITIDSGLGSGLFLDGKLFCGWQNHAGEFGYMQIRGEGNLNVDGRAGTVGVLGPSYKVTKRIAEIIQNGGETKVKKYMPQGMDIPTIEMVVQAIENDNEQLCAQLMAECFDNIACGVVNVAYLLNPEAIFMEDWTARCPACTVDIVRRKMGHYGVSNWRLDTKIFSMQCGKELVAKGTAHIAVDDIFQKMLNKETNN